MGSTSETYENGTNVVVYVANENAHLQLHQHQYHSYNIVSGNLHATIDNETVYDVCVEYGPSSVTLANYDDTATEKNTSLDITDQNDSRDNCSINGDNMRDDTKFVSFNGGNENCDKLAVINNFYSDIKNAEEAFAIEKLNEPIVNLNPNNQEGFIRSESVRSVDSITSGCSSLSSSSAGNNSKNLPNENFVISNEPVIFNNNNSNSNNNNNKQTVSVPSSCKVLPFVNKRNTIPSFQKPTISVPFGWKRLLHNGSIIYISPNNTVLNSLEQVNSYLLTDGNCFCGLDCPLYSHTVFNFDPKVVSSSIPAASGELSKLCNHNRKRSAQTVSSSGLPNQQYENVPSPSTSPASRSIITNNYYNPAVVKKYAFDISDRRKRRKIMPDQLNDDTPVPSPNVMIHNDCDISTKENSTSFISTGSQVENNVYNQQVGMSINLPDQQITSGIVSPASVRLKTPPFSSHNNYSNQPSYYNVRQQNYTDYQSQNDCYAISAAHHNRASQDQNNIYISSQDDFHGNQTGMSSGYVCNSVKTGIQSSQQPCANTPINQHHHINCGGILPQIQQQQQHRIPCSNSMENTAMLPHHRINSPQQQHLPIVQQLPQQFQHQQHHILNQQTNFQQRLIQNHHTNTGPISSGGHSSNMNSQINTQIMINVNNVNGSNNKFLKQPLQLAYQEKLDKQQMYQHHHDQSECTCSLEANMQRCRVPKSSGSGSFCNCYHNDTSHSHQHSSCLQECSTASCNSMMVQNGQGQIIMQPTHHMVTQHDANSVVPVVQSSQQIHHQSALQNPPPSPSHLQNISTNQIQPQQVYPHHYHHTQQQQHQQQQQQQQQQQIHLHMQQQQQQQMHLLHNQSQNIEVKSRNVCASNQVMNAQMNSESEMLNRAQQNYITSQQIPHLLANHSQQRIPIWSQKSIQQHSHQNSQQCSIISETAPSPVPTPPNPYDRVPPLHHHMPPLTATWSDDTVRKKYLKSNSKSPTNVNTAKKPKVTFNNQNQPSDGRSNSNSSSGGNIYNQTASMYKNKQEYSNPVVPSFMEDPSGYLAQQTALLNSTISKQTGENLNLNGDRNICYTQQIPKQITNNLNCTNNNIQQNTIMINKNAAINNANKFISDDVTKNRLPQAKTPDSSVQTADNSYNQQQSMQQQNIQRKNSVPNSGNNNFASYKAQNRYYTEDNLVTSSTFSDRGERNPSNSPSESRSPIQAGTVSTSNQSPLQPGMASPNVCGGMQNSNGDMLPQSPAVNRSMSEMDESPKSNLMATAVASGDTCSSNTITSVLAGKTNTAVVSINSPPSNCNNSLTTITSGNSCESRSSSTSSASLHSTIAIPDQINHQLDEVTKSPLEMVQNVVSSIQIPPQSLTCQNESKTVSQSSIQTSHFLVSNNGQLLVATSNNPQSVVSQQNLTKVNSPIPVMNNSSVVTNVTGTVTQVIPTVGVAQQVLGQPTVLVNTLPTGQLVFQPSVMAVDSAGNAVQIPQLELAVATNNVVQSQTLTDTNTISVSTNGPFSPRSQANLLSPESSKRKANNKKRKISPQQMLQIAQQTKQTTNGTTTSVVLQQPQQQNFAQSAPMLQTLILPNKNNQFASTQPLIATANVLQPVNLVHNIPTIQQFIVSAGLGGMVMTNGDGTATILPETVQLNLLTPMQNSANAVFSQGQGILTASPATGMVIRTQTSSSQSTTQLRPQTISTPTGAQFIAAQSTNQGISNL